jgi:uncharacterized membrane protein (UPF0136 family)
MTRIESNLAWAVALFVAALILGFKDSNALPWAVGAAAVVVGFFTAVLMSSRRGSDD